MLAHLRQTPDGVREVEQPRTRRRVLVPVDDPDCVIAAKDDVVLSEIGMADDLTVACKRRAGGRIMEAADQPRRADELRVGEQMNRIADAVGADVDLTFNEGEDFPPFLVDPEQTRSTIEANPL